MANTESSDFPTSNLHYFLKDSQVIPFIRDERHDIAATDAPIIAPGRFRIFTKTPPKNQVIVIKSISPYIMRRTNVGDATLESFEMISPQLANGFFMFQPMVQSYVPLIVETDVNAPAVMASARDAERLKGPGFTSVTDDPIKSLLFSRDNTFSIFVGGLQPFEIIMQVLPVNTIGGIPNPFFVGNPPIPGAEQNRVDFAGALVYGVTMPEALYNDMNNRWLNLR